MKRMLVIDLDTKREQHMMIGPATQFENEKVKIDPISDMAILCEAVCTLIHLCEQEGIKKSYDSLKDCIKHLKDGFSEIGYKGYLSDFAKKQIKVEEVNVFEKFMSSVENLLKALDTLIIAQTGVADDDYSKKTKNLMFHFEEWKYAYFEKLTKPAIPDTGPACDQNTTNESSGK